MLNDLSIFVKLHEIGKYTPLPSCKSSEWSGSALHDVEACPPQPPAKTGNVQHFEDNYEY